MQKAHPTYKGRRLDISPEVFGELRRSDTVLADTAELRQRMQDDGYLFLPGLLDIESVKDVRRAIFERLANEGALDPNHPVYEGYSNPDPAQTTSPSIDYRTNGSAQSVSDIPALKNLLYSGRLIEFFERYFGGEVLCFEHIWFRAKNSVTGRATPPHYDILYMGRGTHNLFTAWIPYTDISFDMGGIMVLEKSHQLNELRNTYGQRDIDVYDASKDDAELIASGKKLWQKTGEYSLDAFKTQAELGGRWLTTEFKMGDVLVFSPYLMHASAENTTPRMRISSDTRYQLASDAVDDRWAGAHPIGHGLGAKRAMQA